MTNPTLSDIYYKLGSLESKIDSAIVNQRANNSRMEDRLDDHSERLSLLEKTEAKRTGVIIVIVGLFSMVSSFVFKFFASLMQ